MKEKCTKKIIMNWFKLKHRTFLLFTSQDSQIWSGPPSEDLPNWRRVPGFPVFGVGQPTEKGFAKISEKVFSSLLKNPEKVFSFQDCCFSQIGKEKTIWFNCRQEPVAYVNGVSVTPRWNHFDKNRCWLVWANEQVKEESSCKHWEQRLSWGESWSVTVIDNANACYENQTLATKIKRLLRKSNACYENQILVTKIKRLLRQCKCLLRKSNGQICNLSEQQSEAEGCWSICPSREKEQLAQKYFITSIWILVRDSVIFFPFAQMLSDNSTPNSSHICNKIAHRRTFHF